MANTNLPLISCIMPTRDRQALLRQALKYYQRQDYPHKEMIVLDDGNESVGDIIRECETPDIRYIAMSERCNIGMKRNIAISFAHGEIICHFDDDDYYGPARLTRQVAPILQGDAEFSAMRMSLLLDASDGTLWTCDDDTHRQVFKQDVHYGTLMYPVSYWHQGTHFAPVQVGEDRRFVHALLAQDARLARVVDPSSFAYVLHGHNTTSDMRLVHRGGWHQVPVEEYLCREDAAFYEQLRQPIAI
jgi:glycosyltransferase involved in cell wall biosynthesis